MRHPGSWGSSLCCLGRCRIWSPASPLQPGRGNVAPAFPRLHGGRLHASGGARGGEPWGVQELVSPPRWGDCLGASPTAGPRGTRRLLGEPGRGAGGQRRGTEDAGSQQDAEGPPQQPRASIPPPPCMLRPQTPAGDARPRAAAGRAAPASPSSQAASAPRFATGRHAASIADSRPCLCPSPAASRTFWGSLLPAFGAPRDSPSCPPPTRAALGCGGRPREPPLLLSKPAAAAAHPSPH